MEKKIELSPPIMPNFLPVKGQKDFRVPVSDLNYLEAQAYGELMKQAFIKHWEQKRKKA